MTSFAGIHSPAIHTGGADSREGFSNEANIAVEKAPPPHHRALYVVTLAGVTRALSGSGFYASSLCQRGLCSVQIGRVINNRFMVRKGFFPEAVKFTGDILT